MGLLDSFVAFVESYAPWIVAAILVVGILASVKTGLAGGTTAGLLWLAILFILLGLVLAFLDYTEYGILMVLGGALLGIVDAFHERRLIRRDHSRWRD